MVFGFWETERTRSVTPGDKAYLIRVSRGRCEHCDDEIISKGITPNIHHIIEFSSGGSDRLHNLIVLCPNCHSLVHGVGIHKETLRAKIQYRLLKKASGGNNAVSVDVSKKVTVKKVAAKKPTTKKAIAKKVTAKKATNKKASAKKVAAKKAPAKKAVAKKVIAKKAPAKKKR